MGRVMTMTDTISAPGGRRVFLVRHATPYAEGEASRCLGRSDPPLSAVGEAQASALADWFHDKGLTAVYTSPLRRCRATAQAVAQAAALPPPAVREELRELDAGAWDGLTFAEIKARYPREYELRGRDLGHVPPPGGETFAEAGERFGRCVRAILAGSRGDVAVVAHAGVIRAFCCELLARDVNTLLELPQPCGSVTTLRCAGDALSVESVGVRPESALDEAAIRSLYRRFDTPEAVQEHMRAVADCLEALLAGLGGAYDAARLRRAALVHDIARTQKRHADVAADALEREGYPSVAALVRVHQSPEPTDPVALTEADLLFYADKRLSGTEPVSAEERFARSLEKCKTPEALENHRRMREKTLLIEEKIEKMRRA